MQHPIAGSSSLAETIMAFIGYKPVGATIFSFDLQLRTAIEK
jgi:hypothetical protein